MLFDQYYQDELTYLQEMGEVFAKTYPGLAPFLAQKGNDPDVERLLQGFAFLSAKLRLKLDDNFPELTHNLFTVLYPNYLRSIPSSSILQFKPLKHVITGKKTIGRGVEVESAAIDGTPCRFRTCYDVEVYPLMIDTIRQHYEGGSLSISLYVKLQENVEYSTLNLASLRFFINADASTAHKLYLYFFRNLENIIVKESVPGENNEFHLASKFIRQVGFTDDEALLQYESNSFSGFRLIQEYFTLPEKFLFFELSGLSPVTKFSGSGNFEIKFCFNHLKNENLRINNDSLRLFCTPIVNLFSIDADPIRIISKDAKYLVRPACHEQMHHEVFTVDSAIGLTAGSDCKKIYSPFKSFEINDVDNNSAYYQTEIQKSIVSNSTDTYIKFLNSDHKLIQDSPDIISMSLTCSNRLHAQNINVGEISIATGSSPEFVSFDNILPVTVAVSPPLTQSLHWQLISNLSLKYRDYNNVETLVELLSSHHFQTFFNQNTKRIHDLKMRGIISIKKIAKMKLFQGFPIHGYLTEIEMRSNNYSSVGEMYFFCCILKEILGMCEGINSYSQLSVKDLDKNEDYLWPISLAQ